MSLLRELNKLGVLRTLDDALANALRRLDPETPDDVLAAAALASNSSMISLVSSRTWGIISRTRWGVKPLLIRRR